METAAILTAIIFGMVIGCIITASCQLWFSRCDHDWEELFCVNGDKHTIDVFRCKKCGKQKKYRIKVK